MTILSSIPRRQENPLDRGTWRAVAHQVARSQTRLKRQHAHACTVYSYDKDEEQCKLVADNV